VFLFFAVTFLRGFLEGVLEESRVIGFRLEAAQSVEMMFLHGPLFYLSVFSLAALVLCLLARAPIEKTARAVLAFSPVILVAPLVDAALSPHGFRLHYFSDVAAAGRGLAFTFDPAMALRGVSPGMRLEVLLACLGGALYLRAKRGGLVLPVAAFVAVYLVPVLAGSLPALFTLAVRGDVPENTVFRVGGLVFSETRKYALVQLPVAAAATSLCYARFRCGDLVRLLRAARPLRSLFYASITGLGLVMGASFLRPYYPELVSDPFTYLGGLAAVLSVYFLFQFQVILNDYFDREIDQVSCKQTYFTLGVPGRGASPGFGASEAAVLGTMCLGLSLAFAASIGYASLLILLGAHVVGIAYSAPPIRLKRFFLINTFALSLGVLLVAYFGFALFGGRHSVAAFPRGVAGTMIVGFTIALSIKDVGDYAGDSWAGVGTVVTVLGPKWGRRLLAGAMLAMYLAVPFLAKYPLLAVVCVPCGVASALGVLRWGERAIFFAFFVFACAMSILIWNGSVLQAEGLGGEAAGQPEVRAEAEAGAEAAGAGLRPIGGSREGARDAIGRGLGAYLEGVALAEGARWEAAVEQFSDFVAAHPAGMDYLLPQALARMGIAELGQGRAAEAYDHLSRAAATPPFPEDATVYATAAGLDAGRTAEVARLLDRAVKLRPQSARLRLARARVLIDSDPAQALGDLKFAYRCNYDPAVTCAYLGDLAQAAGHVERAERFYREALAADPGSAAALSGLAEILRARGDLDGAAELMKKCYPRTHFAPVEIDG
jgi:4-hydroxybenzoate polyprenyltransferase/tetratricopeptide (TPR) repeat protein